MGCPVGFDAFSKLLWVKLFFEGVKLRTTRITEILASKQAARSIQGHKQKSADVFKKKKVLSKKPQRALDVYNLWADKGKEKLSLSRYKVARNKISESHTYSIDKAKLEKTAKKDHKFIAIENVEFDDKL